MAHESLDIHSKSRAKGLQISQATPGDAIDGRQVKRWVWGIGMNSGDRSPGSARLHKCKDTQASIHVPQFILTCPSKSTFGSDFPKGPLCPDFSPIRYISRSARGWTEHFHVNRDTWTLGSRPAQLSRTHREIWPLFGANQKGGQAKWGREAMHTMGWGEVQKGSIHLSSNNTYTQTIGGHRCDWTVYVA